MPSRLVPVATGPRLQTGDILLTGGRESRIKSILKSKAVAYELHRFAPRDFTVTVGDILAKNMIPVSLGNLFAGAICVAASYSYAFGRLGEPSVNCGISDKCVCCKEACTCCGKVEEPEPAQKEGKDVSKA